VSASRPPPSPKSDPLSAKDEVFTFLNEDQEGGRRADIPWILEGGQPVFRTHSPVSSRSA